MANLALNGIVHGASLNGKIIFDDSEDWKTVSLTMKDTDFFTSLQHTDFDKKQITIVGVGRTTSFLATDVEGTLLTFDEDYVNRLTSIQSALGVSNVLGAFGIHGNANSGFNVNGSVSGKSLNYHTGHIRSSDNDTFDGYIYTIVNYE